MDGCVDIGQLLSEPSCVGQIADDRATSPGLDLHASVISADGREYRVARRDQVIEHYRADVASSAGK